MKPGGGGMPIYLRTPEASTYLPNLLSGSGGSESLFPSIISMRIYIECGGRPISRIRGMPQDDLQNARMIGVINLCGVFKDVPTVFTANRFSR